MIVIASRNRQDLPSSYTGLSSYFAHSPIRLAVLVMVEPLNIAATASCGPLCFMRTTERKDSGDMNVSSPAIVRVLPSLFAHSLVTVSVCRDRSGTDETTRRAAQWVRENVPTGGPSAPEITGGEVFIGFGAPQKPGASSSATATATPDASSVRPSL